MTMTRDTPPATDAELRWAYRNSRFAADRIPYEQALGTPCLRVCLEMGVAVLRRRRARLAGAVPGAGIERSQNDFHAAP